MNAIALILMSLFNHTFHRIGSPDERQNISSNGGHFRIALTVNKLLNNSPISLQQENVDRAEEYLQTRSAL